MVSMLKDKACVLVVDDDPALVTLTRHKLIQRGYEVITAQNGLDAIEIARKEYPDLIISDVDMPIMTGYELCSKVKNDSRLNKIPFMLVTSFANSENLMKGIEAGADNYITKPYDDTTLLSKVEDLLLNPPVPPASAETQIVNIEGKNYNIRTDYVHLLNLLLSTYRNALAQNSRLAKVQAGLNASNLELELTKKEHEDLLYNIFPSKVAKSLLAYGTVAPERYEDVTIMFTDFDGFTTGVQSLSPEQLIQALSYYFDTFDKISDDHKLLKIKTIGDSYMAASGLPERNVTHAIDAVLAALKMIQFVQDHKNKSSSPIPYWPLRIGIHSGEAVVGVIGEKRFAYDMWGNAVNLASRMEACSENNSINITHETYEKIRPFFECEARGEMEVKHMGSIPMYFVKRILPEYSEDEDGYLPNRLFVREYNYLNRTQNIED